MRSELNQRWEIFAEDAQNAVGLESTLMLGADWAGGSANGEGRVGVMAVIWNNPPRIPSIGGRGARGRGQDAHGAN